MESVSEEYGHCSQLLEEIIHNVVAMAGHSQPATALISPNTRIKSLEKNMAEVQLTLSSMLQNTPKTKLNKLRGGSRGGTPDRVHSSGQSDQCDSAGRIEKLRITPDRLKDKRPSSDYVSEMNTPTSLKIRKPSGSPERSASNKSKSLVKLKSQKSPSAGRRDLKKKAVVKSQRFSIFKTRNSTDTRDENAVSFTDKTVGKSLSIRRSSRDNESKGCLLYTSPSPRDS